LSVYGFFPPVHELVSVIGLRESLGGWECYCCLWESVTWIRQAGVHS